MYTGHENRKLIMNSTWDLRMTSQKYSSVIICHIHIEQGTVNQNAKLKSTYYLWIVNKYKYCIEQHFHVKLKWLSFFKVWDNKKKNQSRQTMTSGWTAGFYVKKSYTYSVSNWCRTVSEVCPREITAADEIEEEIEEGSVAMDDCPPWWQGWIPWLDRRGLPTGVLFFFDHFPNTDYWLL